MPRAMRAGIGKMQAKRKDLIEYIYPLCDLTMPQIRKVLKALPLALAAVVNDNGSCYLKEIGTFEKVVFRPKTHVGYNTLQQKPVATRKGPRKHVRVKLMHVFKLRAGGFQDYKDGDVVGRIIEKKIYRNSRKRPDYRQAKT